MGLAGDNSKKVKVALLSVFSNTLLLILKIAVGVAIGSVSIISEAIHSGVDLVASAIALFSVKTSEIPPDRDHPWGHGKIENISGTIEAILIFFAALWIMFEASKKLFHHVDVSEPGIGVLVMVLSVFVNIYVSRRLFQVGKETDSVALIADAWHLKTDIYTSAGVMLGMVALYVQGIVKLPADLYWVDPAAAMIVALMIIRAAYNLTIQSARDLIDAGLPVEEVILIKQLILDHKGDITGFHQLRTRKAGRFRFVEFHLILDQKMSVQDSHELTNHINTHISELLPGTSVTVHVEPCDGSCSKKCLEGCMLSESERNIRFA